METLGQDLVDDVVIACKRSEFYASYLDQVAVHQYDMIGLYFSSWEARFAKGMIEGSRSFSGSVAAMSASESKTNKIYNVMYKEVMV